MVRLNGHAISKLTLSYQVWWTRDRYRLQNASDLPFAQLRRAN